MSQRRALTAVFILLLCAPLGLAQEKERPPTAAPPALLELPKGEGAWALQIVTAGGVMGVGRGNLAFNSEGAAVCRPAREACPASLAPESLRRLSEAVAAADTKSWEGRPTDVCHDCYFTTMTLQRRGADGAVRTHLFTWDDLAAKKMPADVRRLYETALALGGVRQ